MNPFETIKQNLNEDLHLKIPKKWKKIGNIAIIDFSELNEFCLLYTSPSPRDRQKSRMPSSA